MVRAVAIVTVPAKVAPEALALFIFRVLYVDAEVGTFIVWALEPL